MRCFAEEAYPIFEIGGECGVAKVEDRPLFLMSAVGTHQLFDRAKLLLNGVSSPSRNLLLRA